jgi:hypothetical protein
MKKEQKLILAVFAACIVIFFGYWIFESDSGRFSSDLLTSNNQQGSNSGQTSGSGGIPTQFQYLTDSSSSTQPQGKNLTQSFAADMSSDFIAHSQSSDTSSVSDYLKGVGNSSQLNQKLSSLSKESTSAFIQSYPLAQLNIISKASAKDIETYWRSYNNAFKDQIFEFTSQPSLLETVLNKAVQEGDFLQLNRMIAGYQTTLEQIKTMPVPSDLVDFHSKNIAFLNNYIVMLKSFENVKSDPLRAYYVTQNGFPIIQQQSDDISNIYQSLEVRYNL